MKLVYYESKEVDAAVVMVLDDENMLELDERAADFLTGADRQGEIELHPDDARKLERLGMSEGRFYIG